MRRLREQDGIALISATIILSIVLGLAIALLSFADNQQHASAREQAHEVAYQLAEAALNAQISKLGAQWATSNEWSSGLPSNCTPSSGTYPTGCMCNKTTTFTGCPSTTGSWQNSYTNATSGSSYCPPATQTDGWGSSASTSSWGNVNNGWTTYVRDDSGGTGSLFTSSTDQTQVPFDANGDGDVWVRAVGTYHCQSAVVLSKVAEQLLPFSFPRDAVNANSFKDLNNGNKLMLDTTGTYAIVNGVQSNPNSAPGQIVTRCTNVSSACASFRTGQVFQDTCGVSSSPPNGCSDLGGVTAAQTVDSNGLYGLKSEAKAYGTYFSNVAANGGKACPTSASQLASVSVPGGVAPVYIDTDCPSMSFTGNDVINSSTQPGFLVLTDQTLTLGGTVNFYGLIYDANLCGTSPCTTPSNMLTIKGNAVVQGAINVDGAGAVSFGDSGNGNNGTTNFIFDHRIFDLLTEFAGADAAPNSFRQLPNSQ